VTICLGRWVYGGQHGARNYAWAQCRFCGRRTATARRLSASCVVRSCATARGRNARVCHYGFIPGWSRPSAQRECGCKHCAGVAVAKAPRVGRVCADHAKVTKLRLAGGRTLTITQYVAERIAHRDTSKGWQCWRWVE
jgi:hypothetical protein